MKKSFLNALRGSALVIVLLLGSPANAQESCLWGIALWPTELSAMCPEADHCMLATAATSSVWVNVFGNVWTDVGSVLQTWGGTGGTSMPNTVPGCGLGGAQVGDTMAVPVGFAGDIAFMSVEIPTSTLAIANFCVALIDNIGEFCLPNALIPFDPFLNPLEEPDYGNPPLLQWNAWLGQSFTSTGHSWQFSRMQTW